MNFKIQPNPELMDTLRQEKEKTDFLIGILESPKSLFNGDPAKRKYLESKEFPALFIQENQIWMAENLAYMPHVKTMEKRKESGTGEGKWV
ncbi:MAG: hypothetical protein WC865_14150 [Bacteroidales bacterium]